MEALAAGAERDGRPVALVLTTPRSAVQSIAFVRPEDIRQRIAGLEPRAFAPDRAGTAAEIAKQTAETKPEQIVWLSDGLDYGDSQRFLDQLRNLAAADADVTIYTQPGTETPIVVDGPKQGESGLAIQLRRLDAQTTAEWSGQGARHERTDAG